MTENYIPILEPKKDIKHDEPHKDFANEEWMNYEEKKAMPPDVSQNETFINLILDKLSKDNENKYLEIKEFDKDSYEWNPINCSQFCNSIKNDDTFGNEIEKSYPKRNENKLESTIDTV